MAGFFRNNIAVLDTPTLSGATAKTLKVAGHIEWYKDGAWGYAYKKSSASAWKYVPTASKDISETIKSLTASTSYDVCLYVLFDGTYQLGTKATISTTA